MSELSRNATLTQREVEARISDLEDSTEAEYEVYRDKNDEVIDTFGSEDEADSFIDDQDYDRDRVSIRQSGGLDEDDQDELDQLRSFNDECGRDVPDWSAGSVVFNENDTDDDAIREVLQRKYGRPGIRFDEFPFNLIDLSEASDELFSDAGSQYGTLDGTSFYYLA